MINSDLGRTMYGWASDLFPINRSITGEGVRKTLSYLKQIIPELEIKSLPSGQKVFDWEIPLEWEINSAFIEDVEGNRIVDFEKNNLHVVGYSVSVDKIISREELEKHLFSLPEQPDAIPYVTSYYAKNWGFCLSEDQRLSLDKEQYKVYIDSKHFKGELNYGELIIKGELEEEVLLSTYICHPSLANNEISGPVVTTALARWLSELSNRKYTYRVIYIPETIGALAYLSLHLPNLKENVKAGFVVTCVGDDRTFSYLPSRNGKTLADKVALNVLEHMYPEFKKYSWLDRGSDERQYCAPGIDLPVCSIMRSKYGEYPEYHTSEDNLNLISPGGLFGAFTALRKAIQLLEGNGIYQVTTLGEPQLGKRKLYPNVSKKGSTGERIRLMMNFISYCDGTRSLIDIAKELNVDAAKLIELKNLLIENGLLKFCNL